MGLGLTLMLRVQLARGAMLSTETGEYIVEGWQVEEGLPQVSVTSIAQTPDGYLWLGTFNGLVRFDGVRFTVFDEGNTPVLGSSRIIRLDVDSSGILWIVTEAGGLVQMAGGQFAAYQRNESLGQKGALVLVRDAVGRLLVVDQELGLHPLNADRLLPPEESSARPGAELLREADGRAWVREGAKAMPSSRRAFTISNLGGTNITSADLHVEAAAPTRTGGYWLSTTGGVYRLDSGGLRLWAALGFEPKTPCPFALEDAQGNVWLGAPESGLVRRGQDGHSQFFGKGSGLADNHVSALFCDREGNIWVGTGQGGLHRFKPRSVRMYDAPGSPGGNVIASVAEDRQRRLWVGVTGGGLHYWTPEGLARVTDPPELRAYPLIYSVLATQHDALWIGLYGRSALRLQDGKVTLHVLGETLARLTPQALLEDRAGAVWLGTDHGLHRYQEGRFRRYTRQDGLSHDGVHALAEDRHGTLYIGTSGGGLNCLREGRFTSFTEREGLADNHVSVVYADAENTVWIGTANGGLSRFKAGRFVNITMKDGLPSNSIGTLLEDDLGFLWMGSNRGLIRISRQELNQYADGRRRTLPCAVFTRSDGLSTVSCTGNGQPSSCKTRDGKLWFATVKGLAVVDPTQLPANRLPPPVIMEEVTLDDRTYDLQKPDSEVGAPARPDVAPLKTHGLMRLTVPPGIHAVEFRFTGLSLVAPEKVRFRYRLEDYDADWMEAGVSRTAHYTRVPAGQYRFRVTACNNDGVWHEQGAELGVVVLPPWWGTWWFRALAVIAAAGVIFSWVEARVRRVKREHAAQRALSRRLMETQEAERKRIAAELHDSLGQDLLVIKNRALLGLQDEAATSRSTEQFGEISSMATTSLAEVRQISHNLRPYQLDRLGLTKALQGMVTSVSAASGVRCVAHFDSLDGLVAAPMEIHFYRIVQELLNNVVKHSRASEARLSARVRDSRIALVVEDDGCGFDPAALKERKAEPCGMGLGDVAERVLILEGTLHCDSQPKEGTRWTIVIPVTRQQTS